MTQNEIDELWLALANNPELFISKPANLDRLIDGYHQLLAEYEANPTARKRGSTPAVQSVARADVSAVLGFTKPTAPQIRRRRV